MARAVDEHLEVFKRIDAGINGPTGIKAFPLLFSLAAPALQHWLGFARSYGQQGIIDGATGAVAEDPSIELNSKSNISKAIQIGSFEHRLLNEGITHFVSEEMVKLVSAAAAVSEPEPLFATDLPCPHGLVVLEVPLMLHDLHPKTGVVDERIVLPIRAIGWTSTDAIMSIDGKPNSGITMIAYTDMDSYRTVYLPSVLPITGEPMPDLSDERGLQMVEFNPWGFGTSWSDGGDDMQAISVADQTMVSTVAFQRRWLLSLLRLMWQEILVAESNPIERGSFRRMERAGMRRNRASDLKVLKLRRVYRTGTAESTGHTLDHRVIVRGHWKRQFYPSLGPVGDPDSYRRIWIDPYMKGPDDAPVHIKYSVTSIVR